MAQALLVALGLLRESLPLSQHNCPACPACPDLSCGAQTCSGPALWEAPVGDHWSSPLLVGQPVLLARLCSSSTFIAGGVQAANQAHPILRVRAL
eukprot:4517384-Amphidinium_carterae.4